MLFIQDDAQHDKKKALEAEIAELEARDAAEIKALEAKKRQLLERSSSRSTCPSTPLNLPSGATKPGPSRKSHSAPPSVAPTLDEDDQDR